MKEGKIRLTGMTEASFLVKGFINWKDATRGLSKHENSDFHKAAASALSTKANVADHHLLMRKNPIVIIC